MTGARMTAMALLLLCLILSGCAHHASGNIGVGGSFRFQLLHNKTMDGHIYLARETMHEDGGQ